MKYLLLLLLPGCTTTIVKTPKWSIYRVSVLSEHRVPNLAITDTGTAIMTGYDSKPDNAALQSVANGVIQGALLK